MSDELIIKASDGYSVSKFDATEGAVTAVVTSFKNLDVVNDRILPGALDEFVASYKGGLPMLFQHDKNQIIGMWTKFAIEGDKVIGDGTIFPEVSMGKDTMALITRGMIGATSIGFRSSSFDKNDEGGFDFAKIDLVEVSMVRSPANPQAQLISAKNEDGSINIKNLEKALRDAGLSRKEAKTLISDGANELRDAIKAELDKDDLLRKLKSELGGLTNV